jgi:hypothetical protein
MGRQVGTHRAVTAAPAALAGDDELYPVDPQVHVDDHRLDALDPATIRPHVRNAVAYARYAAVLLGAQAVGDDPQAIVRALVDRALASQIGEAVALQAFAQRADDAEVDALWSGAIGRARGLAGTPPSRLARRVADARGQLMKCEQAGYATGRCCAALAPLAALVGSWSGLDRAEQARLEVEAGAGSLYSALAAGAESAGGQPFAQLGLRAWLAVCAAPLADAPATTAGLRALLGGYDAADSSWTVELHPISMAKLAGRRIYRLWRPREGTVSVAESLADDCTVVETEVVRERADGQLDFWAYDQHGRVASEVVFPARPGVDAIKFAPDACMGCHYTFDSRRFVVRVPSYRALHLSLRVVGGQAHVRDHRACARPEERIVWHELPPNQDGSAR